MSCKLHHQDWKHKHNIKPKVKKQYNDRNFDSDDPVFKDVHLLLETLKNPKDGKKEHVNSIAKIHKLFGKPEYWVPISQLITLSKCYREELLASWSKRGLEYVCQGYIDENLYLEYYLEMVKEKHILPHKIQTKNENLKNILKQETWFNEEKEQILKDPELVEILETEPLASNEFLDELLSILYEIRYNLKREEKGKQLYTNFRNQYFKRAEDAILRLDKKLNPDKYSSSSDSEYSEYSENLDDSEYSDDE